jgi:hypothetical protein
LDEETILAMESFVHEFSRAEAARQTAAGEAGAVTSDDVGEIAGRFFTLYAITITAPLDKQRQASVQY